MRKIREFMKTAATDKNNSVQADLSVL